MYVFTHICYGYFIGIDNIVIDWAPFCEHGLTLIPAWISNFIPSFKIIDLNQTRVKCEPFV